MKASKIWGSNIDAQLGQTNYAVRILKENDMSRLGFFAIEVLNFNILKGKVNKSYQFEVYELDQDGTPNEIHFMRFKTKREVLTYFKNFQLE